MKMVLFTRQMVVGGTILPIYGHAKYSRLKEGPFRGGLIYCFCAKRGPGKAYLISNFISRHFDGKWLVMGDFSRCLRSQR